MNIYESLNRVMSEIGAIGKGKSSTQGYKYRGVDDVMNALQPALIHNKVFVAPEVLEQSREERATAKGGLLIYSILKMKYTFYAEDGTNVSAVVIGEGMDSSDKSSNKAMSVAFKYACFQVLCIPTEEMIDPDATNPVLDEGNEEPKKSEDVGVTYINPEQKAQLLAECTRTKQLPSDVAKMVGAQDIDHIPLSVFPKLYKSMIGWESK